MPHLWVYDLNDRAGADGPASSVWRTVDLDHLVASPGGSPAIDTLIGRTEHTAADGSGDGARIMMRTGVDGAIVAVVVASIDAGVRVNGDPLGGIRTLMDRDEILLGTRRLFYSTERLAAVTSFPGPAGAVCPRCRTPIELGASVVRCPGCAVHHCAADERPCWTYHATCAVCDQSTASDATYRWSPEVL